MYCGIIVIFILVIFFDEKSGFVFFVKIFCVILGVDYVVVIGVILVILYGLILCLLVVFCVFCIMVFDGFLFGFVCIDEIFSFLIIIFIVYGVFSGCLVVLFFIEYLVYYG